MIRFIYADKLVSFPKLQHGMFKDRAQQFQSRLKWNVNVNDKGEERDEYDAMNPLYLIWECKDGSHGGSMRLMPTIGRCMLNDHFRHVIGGRRLQHPTIWECTRFCLSKKAEPGNAAALMLAGGEVMRQLGVSSFVGVFDTRMVRVYRSIGASPHVLGSIGDGGQKISVGSWKFSDHLQHLVSEKSGIPTTLMRAWFESDYPQTEEVLVS